MSTRSKNATPTFVVASFVLLISGVDAAQAPPGSKVFTRYTRPMRSVSMNLETGLVTRGPAVLGQRTKTVVDFNNLDLSGFVAVDTGGGFCEWMDVGTKGAPPHMGGSAQSDLVSNFVFAYCSAARDVNSGGPGGTMTWTFYPSHTTGAGHPATSDAVGAFTLTGLPANTTGGTVPARLIGGTGLGFGGGFGFRCFFINISFGSTPLPFADGQIGYSWTFEDTDASGVLAATFPFLSCVSSCTGMGPDGWGMDYLIDQYCPAGVSDASPLATFSFGTTLFGGYFTSLNIDLRELDVAATMSTLGHPSNDDILASSPVVIGSTWTATITPGPMRTSESPLGGLFFTLVSTDMGGPIVLDASALLAGPPFSLLPRGSDAPLSAVLFGGSVLATATAKWSSGPPARIQIPLNTSLLCLSWVAQSVVFGDIPGDGDLEADAKFSTATMGVVGSH